MGELWGIFLEVPVAEAVLPREEKKLRRPTCSLSEYPKKVSAMGSWLFDTLQVPRRGTMQAALRWLLAHC